MSGNGSNRLVLALALVNDLLEEKSADAKDGDNGPDFQGGLALGSTDVGRGFVGACGVAGLAAVEAWSAGIELAGCGGQGETGGASAEGGECCRHGRCGSGYDDVEWVLCSGSTF